MTFHLQVFFAAKRPRNMQMSIQISDLEIGNKYITRYKSSLMIQEAISFRFVAKVYNFSCNFDFISLLFHP